MKYFVFNRTGEGNVGFEELTEAQLLKRLNEYLKDTGKPPKYLTAADIDKHDMGNYGDAGFLIIRGEIVVPKAVEVVTKIAL